MPRITMLSRLSATIGGKAAGTFRDAFGFETVGDLLLHYPRAYIDRGQTSELTGLRAGEHTTVVGRVASATQHTYTDRRTGRTAFRCEVVVTVGEGALTLTFFDKQKRLADWRVRRLPPGSVGMFAGKAEWNRYRKHWQLVHPQTDKLENATADQAPEVVAEETEQLSEIRPVYPATRRLTSWAVERSVAMTLDLLDDVPDPVPADVRRRRGLPDARQALEWIHRPPSHQERAAADDAIRFEEAFVTQAVLAQRRARTSALPATPRAGVTGGLLERFDERLPFALTPGQVAVGEQILADLAAGHPMHRLLQGEVGSGKTVVALRAMLRVVDSGAQAALLAPTEVLAQQHHRSITAMLGDLAAGGMLGGAEDGTRVALLTGSANAAARRSALLDAASGAAGIVIGTHALLEETVQFADLGLVVVDEQHRFGVEQRAALTGKSDGLPPHVLVMTATPIPRTVAMTVFGDLDTSTLTDLPAGRAPTQTSVVPVRDKPGWLERAWERVREECEKGHRAYVVCPRIAGETTDESDMAAVEEVAEGLRAGALRHLSLEVLHGQLPPDRKDRVMQAFAAGEVDVLVSTTVIEVGVDVPDATVMVILDADRFGVSQLHQLRGRVGRGTLPGLCLLVTRSDPGTPARARLDAVAATLDGFELSRVDLEQRREGDVLGTSQSGRRSGLRKLSVLRDGDVIVDAREAAAQVVLPDPDLAAHPGLADAVDRLVETEQADYLEKG